jgi:hypothetical protein
MFGIAWGGVSATNGVGKGSFWRPAEMAEFGKDIMLPRGAPAIEGGMNSRVLALTYEDYLDIRKALTFTTLPL